MGGRNHQPCSTYLPNSTRLSKHLSLAFARLELGNAILEDILLDELDPAGDTAPAARYDGMMSELGESRKELTKARNALDRLREQMKMEGFQDLPTLHKVDLETVGNSLAKKGLLKRDAWQQIREMMMRGGFVEVAAFFDGEIKNLLHSLNGLVRKFQILQPEIEKRNLAAIVEHNKEGNFKVEFAILYTQWCTFQQLFLASSLLSTELWYAFNGADSLLGEAASVYRAA